MFQRPMTRRLLHPSIMQASNLHIQIRSQQSLYRMAIAPRPILYSTLKSETGGTPPKKSLWQRIKEEAVHYAQGSKLLGKEVAISSRLLIKVLKEPLSRRELRQLKRTTADLLRLVPFLIIVLIPFLEVLLPVLLKLFPNMLPSTFESKFQEEEKRRKILKVRLEMASFLQDTVQVIFIFLT